MTTVTNNTTARAGTTDARRLRDAERHPRRRSEDAGSRGDADAFDQMILMARSDLGRSLGLRSVDRDLGTKMFEPAPGDPRGRHQSREQPAALRGDQRDARSLRLKRLPSPNPNATRAVGTVLPSVASTNHGEVALAPRTGDESTALQAQASPHPSDGSRALSAGQTRSGVASRADAAGTAGGHPVNEALGSAAGANAAASGTGVVAASATSGDGANGTRGGVARQVAQILQTGSDAPSGRATAASSTNGRALPGDRSTGQDAKPQASSRESDSSSSNRTAARVSDPTPFDDLVRSIRLHTRPGFSTARIRLDPPELGYMRVDIELTGSQLSLKVRTETVEAARRVQHRVSELKTALERHGIHVDSVDVHVDADRSGAQRGSSYGMGQAAEDGTRKDPATKRRDGRHGAAEGVDGTRGVWDEIDVGRLWGGAEWFSAAHGRVDVRV